MIQAILTMDDGPSGITPEIIDFLKAHDIIPVLFFLGEMLEEHFENGVYALRQGAVVGNHSYSHPNFDEISYAECVAEIEKQEKMLGWLHAAAKIPRRTKLFRFPYGAAGGDKAHRLQQYLRENGFKKLDDRLIRNTSYQRNGFDRRIDVAATFDSGEWQLQKQEFTMHDVFTSIDGFLADEAACPPQDNLHHILLIHDHDISNEIVPFYYQQILEYLLARGVIFEVPRFLEV